MDLTMHDSILIEAPRASNTKWKIKKKYIFLLEKIFKIKGLHFTIVNTQFSRHTSTSTLLSLQPVLANAWNFLPINTLIHITISVEPSLYRTYLKFQCYFLSYKTQRPTSTSSTPQWCDILVDIPINPNQGT